MSPKPEDLRGRKFNKLTPIRLAPKRNKHTEWVCKCDCGNEKVVRSSLLKNGAVKSCGCIPKGREGEDLTGKKFNQLTLIKRATNIGKSTAWLCKCACGNEKIIRTAEIKNGSTKSCGCFSKEMNAARSIKHGETKTRLYKTWINIKERCYNPKNSSYKYYGEKGIQVCDEWKNHFESFRDWSRANGYKDDLTIDRINVYGNYEPSNCRWATNEEQALNRTDNHFIMINGVTKPIAQWAKENNLSKSLIRERIQRGWKGEKLLDSPIDQKIRIQIEGLEGTFQEWSEKTGIDIRVIRKRYNDGLKGMNLIKPVRKAKLIDFKGEKKTIKELAEMAGVHTSTIRNRLKDGLKDDELISSKK